MQKNVSIMSLFLPGVFFRIKRDGSAAQLIDSEFSQVQLIRNVTYCLNDRLSIYIEMIAVCSDL